MLLLNPEGYDRDDAALELFWGLALIVAGKRADQQEKKLVEFMTLLNLIGKRLFFDLPKNFEQVLIDVKMGQYTRLSEAFRITRDLIHLYNQRGKHFLREATLEELMNIPGVGNKTARFFLLYTRPGQHLAVLDTHILKELRDRGVLAPKTTPTDSRLYKELEHKWLTICEEEGKTPTQMDNQVWLAGFDRVRSKNVGTAAVIS